MNKSVDSKRSTDIDFKSNRDIANVGEFYAGPAAVFPPCRIVRTALVQRLEFNTSYGRRWSTGINQSNRIKFGLYFVYYQPWRCDYCRTR